MLSTRTLIAALLASGSVGVLAGASGAQLIEPAPAQAQSEGVTNAAPATFSPRFSKLADMVQAVGPAVVQISAKAHNSSYSQPAESWPYQEAPLRSREALGSGFVVDPSGIIVTNNHVIVPGGEIRVKFADGKEATAKLLGRDEKTDLAVLKVDSEAPLPAVRWGNSDAARVGENVFAVGSPFGLGNSVTAGIISARGREIGAGPYDDFLQVDASINSGNSGGPLFDADGRVLGVNTAIFSPSGGNVGIGFAIPSRLAQSIVKQILTEGEVRRGRIGVALGSLSPDLAQQLGLSDDRGALIAGVDPSGPAAGGSVRPGDVVIGFGGKPVTDSRGFARAVAEAKIGSTQELLLVRGGRKLAVDVAIAGAESG